MVRLGALRLPRQGLGLATDTDGGFCSAACDGLMVRLLPDAALLTGLPL